MTLYPNLFTVKFLILTFPRLGNHFIILLIFKITSFFSISACACKQLNLPNLSTSSNSHFRPLSKVLSPEFSILHFWQYSQNFQFYTSWQLYLATQLFAFNPSYTNATDQYCHKGAGSTLLTPTLFDLYFSPIPMHPPPPSVFNLAFILPGRHNSSLGKIRFQNAGANRKSQNQASNIFLSLQCEQSCFSDNFRDNGDGIFCRSSTDVCITHFIYCVSKCFLCYLRFFKRVHPYPFHFAYFQFLN